MMRDKEKSKPLEEKASGRPTKYKNHASARCRKTKKRFFMLLHTAKRQKMIFSCFCTLQKGQKEVFHASAHCRKAKKKYYKKESIKIQLSLT